MNSFKEVLCVAENQNIKILARLDELSVDNNNLVYVEHKSVNPDYSDLDRYLQKSLIQTAFYTAILRRSEELFVKNNLQCSVTIKKHNRVTPNQSILNFGGALYEVTIGKEEEDLLRFFFTKARASLDYDKSKAFDDTYKDVYIDLLQNCFDYKAVKCPV